MSPNDGWSATRVSAQVAEATAVSGFKVNGDVVRPSATYNPALVSYGVFRLCAAVLTVASTVPAIAQRPDAESLVLTLQDYRCASSAAAAAVLWFGVPVAASPRGRVTALYAASGTIGGGSQPLWAPITGDTVVLIASIPEGGSNPVRVIEEATDRLTQTAAEAHAEGADRAALAARLIMDVRTLLSSLRAAKDGKPSVTVTELRLTAGDLSTARVGLDTSKDVTFPADGGSCRVSFRLLRAERFLRSVSPP